MRSSKSRSRNKSRSNPRSLGNIVNRVFDSSGPEGKVRGTPQQIIEKYLALARDAQLSGDRVAEQSFLQHAEHYTRMLGEAQREQAERQAQFGGPQPGGAEGREERNGHAYQGGQPQGERRDDRGDGRGDQRGDGRGDGRGDQRGEGRGDQRGDGRRDDRSDGRQSRREDREGRREDRDETRREERSDTPPAPAEAVETAPVTVDAPPAAPIESPADDLPGADSAGATQSAAGDAGAAGLPEARGDETAAPVETPENRDAVLAEPQAVPRARKPRAAAAPRRAPTRRRRSDEGENGDAAPVPPETAED